MTALRRAAVILSAIGTFLSGCSDEQHVAPSVPSAASTSRMPASDMTMDQYLQNHGVTVQAQTATDDSPLRIGLQQPPGWFAYDRLQVPNTYTVLTDRRAIDQNFVPNAVVVVHKLNGSFDPRSAILRGFVDTERYKDFKKTRSSLDDFDGFPSAVIEGSYSDDKDRALHVLNRYVLAGSGDRAFAVLLTVTTTEDQAGKLADDLKTLDQGLKITLK
ncbi:LpqN/LpqT family lipoprotein [Segniliparus rugosus]|uniref:Lipoprotein LpqN n=1 Tax=Segniliparus rugosus (strain ATCC BAA-974 / DSM 45345 / CCUG 50838 / CIP 108380 / JCM 13579 / CDC 945) TaxID=679197 RepID=E5XS95_SEGRC|nr:LpqN/LpqT family lipoprotein [Segniliparus rugosus]EFV12779.1 hypothetical protein HMPREF9336_02367 [Segniliparus rugosus ATCC BAA-974]